MTETLALVKRDDFVADIDSLSLLNFTNGIALGMGGWTPGVMAEDDVRGIETLTLKLRGTSMDNLAAVIQSLDARIRQTRRFNQNHLEQYGIWLRDQKAGETNPRQAFILEMAGKPASAFSGPPFSEYFINQYQLGFARSHWESITDTAYDLTSVNTLGGMPSVGTVVGDYPARLAQTRFDGVFGGGGPMSRFWLGFRSARYGTPANFVPRWECELGTLGTDTATTTANDATATGSTPKSIRCSFGTVATQAARCTLPVSVIAPVNYNDQRGKFLVLLRAKLTAGASTVNVWLSTGYTGITVWNTQSDFVTISGTDWKLYELGVVNIPEIGRNVAGSPQISAQSLRIEAERLSGSANLDMDCLILIPQDEGFVYAKGGAVLEGALDHNPVYVQQNANLETFAIGISNQIAWYNDVESQVTGGLPTGTTYAVLAASRSDQTVLTDVLTICVKVFPRWATLRGAG